MTLMTIQERSLSKVEGKKKCLNSGSFFVDKALCFSLFIYEIPTLEV